MKKILCFCVLLFATLAAKTDSISDQQIESTKETDSNLFTMKSSVTKLPSLDILDVEDDETADNIEYKVTADNLKEKDKQIIGIDNKNTSSDQQIVIGKKKNAPEVQAKEEREEQKQVKPIQITKGENSSSDQQIVVEEKRNIPEVQAKEQKQAEHVAKELIAENKNSSSDQQEEKKNVPEMQAEEQKQEAVTKDEETEKKDIKAEEGQSVKDDRKKRPIPIVRKDEEKADEHQQEKLQERAESKKGPIEEWEHKDVQNKLIHKRRYDSLNEHLPTSISVYDYSKQLFYCVKKSDLLCLRGVMNKLEKLGLSTAEILKFRNKLGDTPLIYAVKYGELEVVRFFLLLGADSDVVNYDLKSAIDIAIIKKRVDIINAIAEMIPRLVERKEINNEESSTIYNWALSKKESNCNADH
ncbi:MAG: ankyrin repeat domain-containing protein [Wolbachia endosymbiont of Tyrophagus putrescentiae]|nr:ankyrin repeat domain-containing protein [Wolbachia endosymbiont of Tyrophagus putrescentiae]